MTTATLRPNGTVSNAGPWAITGGGGTAHGALSDQSDASYVTAPAATQALILNLEDLTLPAGAKIISVQPRARCATPSGLRILAYRLRTSGGTVSPTETAATFNTPTDNAGAARQTDGAGGAWTDTKVDGLQLELWAVSSGTLNVYDVSVVVTYAEQPTVNITAPAGPVTTTTRPELTWTYTDPDLAPPARVEAKVFDVSVYGAAGFDPETDPALWTSGDIALSAGVINIELPDFGNGDTPRTYLRAAKYLGGSNYLWSEWDIQDFTITLSPPGIPTITASAAENPEGRIALSIVPSPATPAATALRVEYSDDGGLTWQLVRSAAQIAVGATVGGGGDAYSDAYSDTYSGASTAEPVIVYDHEAPPGQIRRYRARALTITSGIVIASDWSPTNSAVFQPAQWWLKDPLDASLNTPIPVLAPDQLDLDEPLAEFAPLGRSRPVILADDIDDDLPEHSEHTLLVRGAATYERIRTLLRAQRVLLLQSPFGDHRYIRITQRRVARTLTPTNPRREVTITCRHVDPPAEIPTYLIWDETNWDEAVYG